MHMWLVKLSKTNFKHTFKHIAGLEASLNRALLIIVDKLKNLRDLEILIKTSTNVIKAKSNLVLCTNEFNTENASQFQLLHA